MNSKLLMIAALMAALAACGKKGEEPATIAEPVKAEPVIDPNNPAGVGVAASQKFLEVAQLEGQGSRQGFAQGQNPLQQGYAAEHVMQGQDLAQQTFGAGSGQGGQNVGQQGVTQGQQFHGQQGQSGQGSFQGGNYGQQSQGQSWQQGTSGSNQQVQSGGTQGPQGSSSQQAGSLSGSTGAEEEHMDSVEYYQELARRQYATLKQECDTLKKDPNVYEQCQTYAKSVRDKIAGMAEQGEDATQRSKQRGG